MKRPPVPLIAILICLMVVYLGCASRSSELVAYNRMRNVWVAIRNYEENNGSLPAPNANSWRFSNRTSYDQVSWKALLLDYMVAISEPGENESKQAVEKEIDQQGKNAFIVNHQLIYSNLAKVHGRRMQELPGFSVLAFTVESPGDDWNRGETESVEEIVRGTSQVKIPLNCFLLFANGNVGVLQIKNRFLLLELLDPSLHGISRESLERSGIRILEPSKQDYR